MSKNIPIPFSTEMVQAILEGRKTQTRRTLKHKSTALEWLDAGFTPDYICSEGNEAIRPYNVGDVLWVREGWRLKGWDFEDGTMAIGYEDGTTTGTFAYDPTNDSMWLLKQVEQLEDGGYIEKDPNNPDAFRFTEKKQPFKLARFMPKEACRLWLKVKAVRVERLQEISEQDAESEGAHFWSQQVALGNHRLEELWCKGSVEIAYNRKHEHPFSATVLGAFYALWQSIYSPESWNENPWVWVIEFERCEMPDNFLQAKPQHINQAETFKGFM